jgi:uncharacterized protein with FMN-binding domain
MKRVFKIILVIVIIFAVIAAGGIFYLTRGLNEIQEMTLNGINLSNISDGSYYGSYVSGRWTNTLEVHVEGGRISKINVFENVRFVQDGVSDALFSKVVSAQDTRVDTVSGATITSKAYLKAIENALVQ